MKFSSKTLLLYSEVCTWKFITYRGAKIGPRNAFESQINVEIYQKIIHVAMENNLRMVNFGV